MWFKPIDQRKSRSRRTRGTSLPRRFSARIRIRDGNFDASLALVSVPSAATRGAVAQLGERLNGIQEVDGSIPFGSTKNRDQRLNADPRGSAFVLYSVIRPEARESCA